MVTGYATREVTYNAAVFKLHALAADDTGEKLDGVNILNGSTLKEIDTGKEFVYDQDGKQWRKKGNGEVRV